MLNLDVHTVDLKRKYRFNYFQVARQCHCGDDPHQYGPEDVSNFYIQNYDCDRECLGNSEQICGGGWRLSVYETGNETDS